MSYISPQIFFPPQWKKKKTISMSLECEKVCFGDKYIFFFDEN